MGYTVKDVKAIIENLDDDTPLFGFILGPEDVEVYKDGEYVMPVSESDWTNIINKANELAGNGRSATVWDVMWEIMNDAKGELFPEDGE